MTHRTKTPFGQHTYELCDRLIDMRGSIPMKGRFEAKIAYADLSSTYDRLWLRGPYLNLGIWFAALGLGAYFVETVLLGMDGWSEACLFTLMWAVVGLVLMLFGLPKYQIVRFKTKTGIAALDVFEAGPTKDGFSAFIAEIVRRIENCETRAAQT